MNRQYCLLPAPKISQKNYHHITLLNGWPVLAQSLSDWQRHTVLQGSINNRCLECVSLATERFHVTVHKSVLLSLFYSKQDMLLGYTLEASRLSPSVHHPFSIWSAQ